MKFVRKIAFAICIFAAMLAMSVMFCSSAGALEVWDGTVAEAYAGGDGTKENPYLISNGAELAFLMKEINSVVVESEQTTAGEYYRITSDIYLNDISDYSKWSAEYQPANLWTPGGKVDDDYINMGFAGHLDGGNYDIKGLYVGGDKQFAGLFGYIFNGCIENVNVTHSYISGSLYCAGIAGTVRVSKNAVSIIGCSVSDTKIFGRTYVGGIAGYAEAFLRPILFEKCSSDATVTAKYRCAAGIAACVSAYNVVYNDESKNYAIALKDCINSGNITAASIAGGIIGSSDNMVASMSGSDKLAVLLERCVNLGNINCTSSSGSIAGILGPERGDERVVVHMTNCYGKEKTSPALFGVSKSDYTETASAVLEGNGVAQKNSYNNFNFTSTWNITKDIPALRKLGDTMNEGLVTGNGIVSILEHITGIKTDDIETANVDFDKDGVFTMKDINQYFVYLRGKGASKKMIVVKDYTKHADGDSVIYEYTAFNPGKTFIETEITGTSAYETGDILFVEDGNKVADGAAVIGNAYTPGAVYNAESPVTSGKVGYVEVEAYDAETGVLRIVGSDAVYKIDENTAISFSDKSDGIFHRKEEDIFTSTAKSYRQDDNKEANLRVVLFVLGDLCEENTYRAFTAMVVRD